LVRVPLDEQLPLDLAATLQGHSVDTVAGRGWVGITNGELLRLWAGEYDALVTMDGVLLVRAPSHRMVHLQPLVPAILDALHALRPGQLHRIGG